MRRVSAGGHLVLWTSLRQKGLGPARCVSGTRRGKGEDAPGGIAAESSTRRPGGGAVASLDSPLAPASSKPARAWVRDGGVGALQGERACLSLFDFCGCGVVLHDGHVGGWVGLSSN
jgi:hypothetical protein